MAIERRATRDEDLLKEGLYIDKKKKKQKKFGRSNRETNQTGDEAGRCSGRKK